MKLHQLIFLISASVFLSWRPHPFYVSVTDIKYDEKNKSVEIACKLFTNDVEDALKKLTKKPVDILNSKDKKEIEAILSSYIKKRLQIKVNGKPLEFNFLGYEKEEEAIWCYMEAKASKPKTVWIDNKLLYDFLKSQINIVHIEVSGDKQSYKVTNPESEMNFSFK